MLTLIAYPPQFGEISASPFCVKALYVLNASGLPWQREDTNDPRKMPHAKLPVLRTPSGMVSGSDAIVAHVAQHGTDIDAALTPQQRAVSHALTRMIEEHLYFLLALDRWERDEVWPLTRDAYFHEIPALVRPLISGGIRRTMLKGMHAQGLGRMSWAERLVRADHDLAAIAGQLNGQPFLFGDTATGADAAIGPVLSAIMATPVQTDLVRRVQDNPDLQDYAARVHTAFGEGAPRATG